MNFVTNTFDNLTHVYLRYSYCSMTTKVFLYRNNVSKCLTSSVSRNVERDVLYKLS